MPSDLLNQFNITLRQIQMAVAVARKGSIRRAAEELGLTQSAVSMGIKEAEQQLGNDLFNRTGNKLRLNEKGRQLLPRMEELLRQVQELGALSSGRNSGLSGHLVIGASSSIGCYLLPQIIADFRQRHTAVEIDLIVHNSADILRDLHEAEIDLAFTEGKSPDARFEMARFCEDRMIAFGALTHPLMKHKNLRWKHLAEETWLLREAGSGTQDIFNSFCQQNGITLRRIVYVGDIQAIKRMVELGMGIACLSRLTVEREIKQKFLQPFPVRTVKRHFYLVRRRRSHPGLLSCRFIEEAQNYLEEKSLSTRL